jgi:hypothetical protein
MGNLNPRIAELRQHLMTEKDFSVIFNKFFDITETDMAFMRDGQMSQNAPILSLVKTSIGIYFQKKEAEIKPKDMMFIENQKENLFHGSGLIFGHIFTFFYFQDLDKGMLGLCKIGTPQTTFMRITIEHLKSVKVDEFNAN